MGPGDVIAQRYRLLRLIGRGGMGSVWAAEHTVTGKSLALKFLHPRDDDGTARRRVLREARAACAVQHPGILAVHDVLEADDGSPVLVMDLLAGESLRARLDRERTLSLADTLAVVRPVLDALVAAHEGGVVHRDLKPDNLFLLSTGEVKILDFGVAKLMARDGVAGGSGALTATGAMIGTPYYMAPEQAFGDPVDARADLWAMGVILYECLSGEPPTQAENLGQVLRLLTNGKLEPLEARVPATLPAVASIVRELLSIDPAGRPASARAVLDALTGAEDAGAPPHADVSPPSRAMAAETPDPLARTVENASGDPEQTARRPARGRVLALALAGGAAALILIAVGFRGGPDSQASAAASPTAAAPAEAPLVPATAVVEPPVAPIATAAAAAAPSTPPAGAAPAASSVPAARADKPRSPASSSPTVAPAASAEPPSTKLLTKVPF